MVAAPCFNAATPGNDGAKGVTKRGPHEKSYYRKHPRRRHNGPLDGQANREPQTGEARAAWGCNEAAGIWGIVVRPA